MLDVKNGKKIHPDAPKLGSQTYPFKILDVEKVKKLHPHAPKLGSQTFWL
jgi:hypothetical protein